MTFEVLKNQTTHEGRYNNMPIKPKNEYSVITEEGLVVCNIPDFYSNAEELATCVAIALNNMNKNRMKTALGI